MRSQIKKLDNEERERILKDTKSVIRSYSYGAKCLHNWKKNMRIFTLTLAIFLLWFGSAVADDDHDHVGECEIVGWEWSHGTINIGGVIIIRSVTIEGSTTCASGSITIDLYEGTGESRTFIGTADGGIRGYAFSVTKTFDIEKTPSSLSIEYSIEPEEVVVADPGVQCKIEDVRWWHSNVFFGIPLNDQLRIEGSTTCASGFVTLRLYEGTGESRTFIGTVDGRIRGYAFSVTTEFGVETPSSLSIEYSIEPEEVVVADPDVQCKIEDWQWDRIVLFNDNDQLRIEGSTTCASGFVTIRLYEGTGESRTFIGTVDGRIRGYAFSVTKTFDVETKPSSLSIEYSIEDVNDAPVITTVSLADATEGVAYDDTVKAIDRDVGDRITFAKVSGPDWMTVGENGAVGGIPGVSDVGSDIAVSIGAEDAVGAADTLTTSIAVIAKDVVVMADPDIQNEIPIPADRSSISLDFSNSVSLSIAFTGGEVANQIISVKQISTSNIAEEFPTVPAFTNAVYYIDINLDVHNSEAELTFGYDETLVTGFGLNEDSLVVSVYDSLDARGFIWHVLPSTIDTDNNTITVTTDHFSLWVVASSSEALITAVDDAESVPRQFGLNPNYPNPFNPVTTITYNLDRTGIVVVTIYDVLGKEVRTLVNTQQVSGSHTVVWDGRNNAGIPVASGTYISLLQSENRVVSGKLTLVR